MGEDIRYVKLKPVQEISEESLEMLRQEVSDMLAEIDTFLKECGFIEADYAETERKKYIRRRRRYEKIFRQTILQRMKMRDSEMRVLVDSTHLEILAIVMSPLTRRKLSNVNKKKTRKGKNVTDHHEANDTEYKATERCSTSVPDPSHACASNVEIKNMQVVDV